MVKRSEVLQCSDGLSNSVCNIIRRRIENMKLLLVRGLLLSHSFIFLSSIFYQCIYGYIPFSYMVVFLFHIWLYSCFAYSCIPFSYMVAFLFDIWL